MQARALPLSFVELKAARARRPRKNFCARGRAHATAEKKRRRGEKRGKKLERLILEPTSASASPVEKLLRSSVPAIGLCVKRKVIKRGAAGARNVTGGKFKFFESAHAVQSRARSPRQTLPRAPCLFSQIIYIYIFVGVFNVKSVYGRGVCCYAN